MISDIDWKIAVEAKDKHNQLCPDCSLPLVTINNYPGGGSHYWTLVCDKCSQRFVYSSYDWKLRTWPKDRKEIPKSALLKERVRRLRNE